MSAALLLALFSGAPGAAGQGQPGPEAPSAASSTSMTVEQASQALALPESDASQLAAAASALLARAQAPEALKALRDALLVDRRAASRIAIAEQIARDPGAPPRLLIVGLAENLDASNPQLAGAMLRALSRFQSREAVRAILDGMFGQGREAPPALASQAFETLSAQTGITSFGEDLAAWRDWWSRAQWLTEQEWRTQVGRQQATAAEGLRKQRNAAVSMVVDLYRRLHAAAPDASRPDLLVEMMTSPESDVRRLGLDLTMRALLNGKAIEDVVAEAVAARLADNNAAARMDAASILDRLNRPQFGLPLREALRVERNPGAAAAMLRAAQRDPDRTVIAAALQWLRSGPPASDAAISALLAARSQGTIQTPGLIAEVRSELERLYPNLLTKDAMSLMIALDDGQAIVALLDSQDAARATLAANALVDWEPAVDALVAAAGRNAGIRDSAVRSLMKHRLTAKGFDAARALLNVQEPAQWETLLQYARSLPAEELLAVASAERNLEQREALIAHTVTPDFLAQVDDPTARVDLLVLALQTRLALGRAADALAVLDATPTEWLGPRLRALRVTALLCLNRIADAIDYTRQSADLGADAMLLRAWLDAFALCVHQPYAAQIRDSLMEQFPDVATSAEAYRFGALTNRLPIPEPAATPVETPPAPGDAPAGPPTAPAGS